MLKHLSYSSLKLHQTNPRRWCLVYLEGIKEAVTPALDLGLKVHKYIENGVYNIPKVHIDLDHNTKEVLNSYLKTVPKQTDIRLETRFSDNLGEGLPFVGCIDMWYKQGSDLLVFDHKTAHPKYVETEKSLRTNWQLSLYAYTLTQGSRENIWVGHNQFIKDLDKGCIKEHKQIKIALTKKELCDNIDNIRKERENVLKTIRNYKEYGILSIRETPQNKFWFGKFDPLWPYICGAIPITILKEKMKYDK